MRKCCASKKMRNTRNGERTMDIPRDWITSDVYAEKYGYAHKSVKQLVYRGELRGIRSDNSVGPVLYVEDRMVDRRIGPKVPPREDGKVKCCTCHSWLDPDMFGIRSNGNLRSQCNTCLTVEQDRVRIDVDIVKRIHESSREAAIDNLVLTPVQQAERERRISDLAQRLNPYR